ncbi:MAG: phosphate ABC transporter permease subunit PstC [Phoenicibacter congonensis]|uniref:Phosphate transport system permease protein n=1 Tax=Phoenicibacter congonensis TaxID=1944646 RepID=A0AA43RK24_9ACTN|nr:phosphate ABC transporter permease subunit PstC [Phoenicibacter congonensis]
MKSRNNIRPATNWADVLFSGVTKFLSIASIVILCFVIFVIIDESVWFLTHYSIVDFLFGTEWMPVDYGTKVSFGIGNFIAATLAVSCLGLLFAFVVSVFAALYLCSIESSGARSLICAGIDLLAGAPSVIYGFVGLVVLAKMFLEAGHPTGSCVLTASIVLAVMLLPFMISSFAETMRKVKERYQRDSMNLGVGKWYFLAFIVLPNSMPQFLPPSLRAFARGIGETMAVMMVVGNANLFPELLGKSETIASLIALEMGAAEAGSMHSSALFASGLVLLVIVFLVNIITISISNALKKREHKRQFAAISASEPNATDNATGEDSANSSAATISSSNGNNSSFLMSKAGGSFVHVLSLTGIAIAIGLLIFTFGYCFVEGYSYISWEFLTTSPSGAVLGEEGGIYPAIIGSLMFVLVSVVLAFPLSCAFALYQVFFCKSEKVSKAMGHIFGVCAGVPSIVLGLFVYAVLVRNLGFGRCVLSGGVALALMILPFLEVRFENAFKEIPEGLVRASLNLGCSVPYTVRKIIMPACAGEILATVALGASFAMGACAPLIFTGGVAFAPASTNIFSPAMALPLHLYLMLAQQTTIPQVYATAFVMMAIVLVINAIVAVVSTKGKKKWRV